MPTQTDELFELRLRADLLGASVINLFHYRRNPAQAEVILSELAAGFKLAVVDVMITAQNIALEHIDLRVRQFGEATEFVLDLTGVDGTRPGSATNSFTALGYTLLRNTIDIRNGSKRIGGVSENDVGGNELDMDFISIAQDVADALSTNITLDNTAVVIPMIYRRDSFVDGEWFGGNFGTAIFRSVTSQTSRKVEPS